MIEKFPCLCLSHIFIFWTHQFRSKHNEALQKIPFNQFSYSSPFNRKLWFLNKNNKFYRENCALQPNIHNTIEIEFYHRIECFMSSSFWTSFQSRNLFIAWMHWVTKLTTHSKYKFKFFFFFHKVKFRITFNFQPFLYVSIRTH